MSPDQGLLFGLLALLVVLLIWGPIRYDVVAFGALIACVVAGLIPATEAFAGFGHPATVTVALVLALSKALSDSGATDIFARAVQPAAGRTTTHIAALGGVSGRGTPVKYLSYGDPSSMALNEAPSHTGSEHLAAQADNGSALCSARCALSLAASASTICRSAAISVTSSMPMKPRTCRR